MKKGIILLLIALSLSALFAACSCNHSYTEKITKNATCGADGERTKTCSNCGKTITEVIPATGAHDYIETITSNATCGTEGSLTKACSICNKTEVSVIEKTDTHTYTERIITEANCKTPGKAEKECSVCKNKISETIPTNDTHTTRWGKCSRCNTLCTELKSQADTIAEKFDASMTEMNECLDYIEKALKSKYYTGTGSAVLKLAYSASALKAAATACGDNPEFADIKKQLQNAGNTLSSTFSGTVSTYGDSRDLTTLRKILEAFEDIESSLKKISNTIDTWKTYA